MNRGEVDVGFLLKQIATTISRVADQSLRPATMSQLRVLIFLSHQPEHTCCQRDIEHHFDVSHPTVVGLIKRLEAKGLIHSETAASDRRKKELHLTADGEALLKQAAAHRSAMEAQLCKGIAPEDIETLRGLLAQIYQNALELAPIRGDTFLEDETQEDEVIP